MADKPGDFDDLPLDDAWWDDGDWDDLDDLDEYCEDCGLSYEDCICDEICDICGCDLAACDCDLDDLDDV